MKKFKGLGAMLLAGFLVIPGNLGLASQVLAQSDTQTDKQLQDVRQKRQETLQEQEREAKQQENTGQRKKTPSSASRMPSSARKPPTPASRTSMKKGNKTV